MEEAALLRRGGHRQRDGGAGRTQIGALGAIDGDIHFGILAAAVAAQAERSAALWPNKGEDDVRPAQGEPYRRLNPIAPKNPVVPAGAPGALSLPIVEIRSGSDAGVA